MDTNEVNKTAKGLDDRSNEPISMENIPLAIGCILDDVAQIKSIVTTLFQHLGLGAAGTKPVTVKEVAQFLSITERAVNKMVRERTIPYYQRNGKIYFFEKELLEWVKESRVATFDEEIRKHNQRYRR